jgi:PleD family two-component response regulator
VELENECNQDKLIKKVDNALYESKRIGKNKVTFL